MQNAIHAKALRKRGTDKWYGINAVADKWIERKLPELWHKDYDTLEGIEFVAESTIPPNAELVDIIIIVQEGGEG
jgi:hypothetical protein